MNDRSSASAAARAVAKKIPPIQRLHAVWSRTSRREAADGRNLRLLLAFVLRRESNCVDIGAHEGAILADILRVATEGRHIAFEPLPALSRNLRARFPTVDVRDVAVGNQNGEASFVFVHHRPALSGFRERSYPGRAERELITVAVQRLDDALPDGYVPTLIKIDVEGAEREVLEGAADTVARHQPVVVFEHGKGAAPAYGSGPRDIFALLVGHARLRIFDLNGRGPFSASEFETIFERGDRWNFVAHA